MGECRNCESFVTDDYARVFTPRGVDNPRACPDCPDKVRDGRGRVRDARSSRQGGAEPSEYDPAKDPGVDIASADTETAGGSQ